MPTILTHAVVGVAISRSLSVRSNLSRIDHVKLDAAAAVLAMAPDFDVVSFALGVSYGDHFGHRGFTHSVSFAAIGAVVGLLATVSVKNIAAWKKLLIFFLATLSHPLLDMLTNGGLGCAIFAPLDWNRYFMPDALRIIPVSPIAVKLAVLHVIMWEMILVWPIAILAIVFSRRFRPVK